MADLSRPLPDLLRDLRQVLEGHRVVAHNAGHDRAVLEASYRECGLNPPLLEWTCTLDLAQRLHPGLESYALPALCDRLAVGDEPFHRDSAHQAAYDARYTYHLFRLLERDDNKAKISGEANPFTSSRVDTPFQIFADDQQVNQDAFRQLSSLLRSVAADSNRQAQGALLIGEPGSGKTHLVMRMAREVLASNRLLFVRQPTQADHVLFHIYSRTLESLVERVGDGCQSQLDLLLIRAIRKLFVADASPIQRDREILAAMEAEDFERLGFDGSEVRRARWERIEVRLLRWWGEQQGAAGFGRQILQGLLRYCRYTKPRMREACRRWLATGELATADSTDEQQTGQLEFAQALVGLSPWNDVQLREEFSLQALRVIGLLCTLDQPLILVFDQLEGLWLEGNRPVLMRFGQVVKELFTHVPYALILLTLFPDRWQAFQRDFDGSVTDRVGQHVIALKQPRPDQIEEILDLRLKPLGATARGLFSSDELQLIQRQPSLRRSLNRAAALYEHRVHGVPMPTELPPAPLERSLARSDVPWADRVLQLEQQLSQMLDRLSQLERDIQHAQPLQPATAALIQAAEVVPSDLPVRDGVIPEVPEGSELESVGGAEADFLQYRKSSLLTLQARWEQPQIVDESDDAGKLTQICLAHERLMPLKVDSLKLGSKRVPGNVLIRIKDKSWCVAFLHVNNANSITARLANLNQLVSRHRRINFMLMRDGFASTIRSPKALEAMEAFRNGSGDGQKRTHWMPLDHERRVALEFVFQLVTDILNREIELSLTDGLALLARHEPNNWIVKLLHQP